MRVSLSISRHLTLGVLLAVSAPMALPQGQTTGGTGAGAGTGTTGGGATTGGGIGGGTTGGGANTNSRTTTSIPSTTPTQPQQFPTEMQRPIFLSGKVSLEDGTAPPETVVIERVCNGSPRPEAYTDSKGRFQFQLGQNNGMMADASVGNMGDFGMGSTSSRNAGSPMGGMGGGRGVSERDLMGCELRAVLPGYRSESINLASRRFMDNPEVGTIVLRRMANVEGLTFSATSAMAPKDAKKAFDKGKELVRKKKPADAQKEFEKAVQIYPKYANAWADLGQVLEQQQQPAEARNAYEQALKADSKLVLPYVKLSMMYGSEKKWKECAEASGRALKLNPFDFPEAFFYSAVANLNLQNLDEAEKSARDGIKLDSRKRIPKMRHVLGIVLAQKNDVPGAMENMKDYMAMLPQSSPDIPIVKGQIAQLEKVASANQPKAAEAQQQQ